MRHNKSSRVGAFQFVFMNPNQTKQQRRVIRHSIRSHSARVSAIRRDRKVSEEYEELHAENDKPQRPSPTRSDHHGELMDLQTSSNLGNKSSIGITRSKPRPRHAKTTICSVIEEPDEGADPGSFTLYNNRVLHIFTKIVSPSAHGYCAAYRRRHIYNAECLAFMNEASFYYAVSASSLLTFETLQQCRQPNTSRQGASPRVLATETKALEQIRGSLVHSNGVASDATIMAIASVGILASRLGKHVQQNLHRQALESLIRRRGGLTRLGEYAQAFVLSVEYSWAIDSGYTIVDQLKSILEQGRYQSRRLRHSEPAVQSGLTAGSFPPPSTISVDKRTEFFGLPPSFKVLATLGLLSATNVRSVQGIVDQEARSRPRSRGPLDATRQFETADENAYTTSDSSDPNAPFDLPPQRPLYLSLFEACPDAFENDEDGKPTLNWFVSLGLLLYSSHAFNDLDMEHTIALWPNTQWARKQLTHALVQKFQADQQQRDLPSRMRSEQDLVQLSSGARITESATYPFDSGTTPTIAPLTIKVEKVVDNLFLYLSFLAIASWIGSVDGLLASDGQPIAELVFRQYFTSSAQPRSDAVFSIATDVRSTETGSESTGHSQHQERSEMERARIRQSVVNCFFWCPKFDYEAAEKAVLACRDVFANKADSLRIHT